MDITRKDFRIEEYSDHIKICTCLIPDEECINIPDEINGRPVTDIGHRSFFNCKCKYVNIPDTVKTIESEAFAMCRFLTEAIIPDSVTIIEPYAYRDCRSLKKIVVSSSVKCLSTGIFSFCYLRSDTEIQLKEGLEEIESHVFYDSTGSSVTIRLPESVKKIAVGAFAPGGMKIVTSLPHDDGWFSHRPYGESVVCNDKGAEISRISDIYQAEGNCEIHKVMLSSGSRNYFYPCDYTDGIIEFVDPDNKSRIADYISGMKKADDNSNQHYAGKLSDTYRIRTAWKRGLI